MNLTDVGAALRIRRETLRGELTALTARPAEATPSVSFGKRVGDGTTEAVERINTTAAARSIAASLAEADRALAKLDEDSYGLCDGCGRPIGDERLEAIAWATVCVSCADGRSGNRGRGGATAGRG
jgi:DnaK suppressor protein